MLKDANRRKFDVVMAWAIDRLGRSLIDLLGTIEHLQEVGVDLYLDQQHIDTTTPTGKLLFQITGAFAEFERSMIRQRIRAGLSVIKEKIARDGKFVSKDGRVRRKLGRPGAEPDKIERARLELARDGSEGARLASASAPSTGFNARLGNMRPIDVGPSANGTYWPQDGKSGLGRYPPWPGEQTGKIRARRPRCRAQELHRATISRQTVRAVNPCCDLHSAQTSRPRRSGVARASTSCIAQPGSGAPPDTVD